MRDRREKNLRVYLIRATGDSRWRRRRKGDFAGVAGKKKAVVSRRMLVESCYVYKRCCRGTGANGGSK